MEKEKLYLLALSMMPSIGAITARKLIAYAGSAEAVFRISKDKLRSIPGIGEILASRAGTPGLVEKAEKEIRFCKKNEIKILSFYERDFPVRLKQCPDAPLVLFYRGEHVFNSPKLLSFVGTRRASPYGTEKTYGLIRDLAASHPEVVIVSGLAYGIDYHSHMAALKNGLKTIAVMGHGLHTIYPYAHKDIALKILEHGCLCSDFSSGMEPERNNFIKRNRIIAGLADATLVVESACKGGALITADIAGSYNRDVFALPGRAGDEMSEGCNQLIKSHKAGLIEDCRDLEYFLGWESGDRKGLARQKLLFTELSEEEEAIIACLREKDKMSMNELCIHTGIGLGKISTLLLNLEFEGIIGILPGNFYRLN